MTPTAATVAPATPAQEEPIGPEDGVPSSRQLRFTSSLEYEDTVDVDEASPFRNVVMEKFSRVAVKLSTVRERSERSEGANDLRLLPEVRWAAPTGGCIPPSRQRLRSATFPSASDRDKEGGCPTEV